MGGNFAASADIGEGVGGVLGIAALGVIGANIYGLFYWPWVSGVMFGYAALCGIVLGVPLFNPSEDDGILSSLGRFCIGLSLAAALIFSLLVGGLQYMMFKTAALILFGLFTLGALFFLFHVRYRPTLILNLLFAVLLALGIQYLPPPPGSLDDEADLPGRLKLMINVVDQDGNNTPSIYPIEIYVNWVKEGEAESEDNKVLVGLTNQVKPGEPVVYKTWQDPAGRIAVITSLHKRGEGGYYHPARLEVRGLTKGEKRQVKLTTVYSP